MDLTDRFLILIAVLLAMLLSFLICNSIHLGTSSEHIVEATVVEKEYIPKTTYTAIVPMGKTLMPQTRTRPEEYNIVIKWEGGFYTIDSEAKFNSYEVGDSIPVTCVTWFRKDGTIKKQFIRE